MRKLMAAIAAIVSATNLVETPEIVHIPDDVCTPPQHRPQATESPTRVPGRRVQ